MDILEMARTISSIVGSILIPIVILYISNAFSRALKERDIQAKFVELSVSILKERPAQENINLRIWASEIINHYSGVKLTAAARKDLVENTSFLHYEKRIDLGNRELGDGQKFKGRGYVKIIGRANYEWLGAILGTDLVSYPEKLETPVVAAEALAEYFIARNNNERLFSCIESGDYKIARKIIVGGINGGREIEKRTSVYVEFLQDENKEIISKIVPGVTNPEWTKNHLPTILRALESRGISSKLVVAYILATAEYESKQGTEMYEIG